MPTEMTMRDHFAAAALTGLLARGLLQSNLLAADAYKVADAMLRERDRTNHDAATAARASLSTADHAVCRGRESDCGTGVTPAIDRLREWERYGSGRWGLGAAGDVTMLERRLAMVEAIVHDAAPAARASGESVVPQPTPRGDSDRTDKAAPRPSEGTGDTPAMHATPPQGIEPRECTEPVACAVMLTDAERDLLDTLRRSGYLLPHGVTIIDGLLERLGGGE